MNIDCAVFDDGVAHDGSHQLTPRESPARVPQENFQQSEFSGGQGYSLVIDSDPTGLRVNANRA